MALSSVDKKIGVVAVEYPCSAAKKADYSSASVCRNCKFFLHRIRFRYEQEKVVIMGIAAPPSSRTGLPLYLSPVKAGFLSPADDFIDRKLDLHEYLVHNEAATFFLRAQGDSMTGAGIHDSDLLIVDRSFEAAHDKSVIAALDGELTVKRFQRVRGKVFLAPENPDYPIFDITEKEYVYIWGMITYVIHKC